MAIWTQILSCTLLCSLAQGLIVYAALRLILNLLPTTASRAQYKCSLAAMALLLLWSGLTLWQQVLHFEQVHTYGVAELTGTTGVPQSASLTTVNVIMPALTGIPYLFPCLAAMYLAGLGLMLLRLVAGIRQLTIIRTKSLEAPDDSLNTLLHALQSKLELRRRVRLFIAARSRVPMVIGFIKPVILLPAASVLNLTPEQLETILLHELAHIKRHDFLVNMLQTIVETILFFNPFVWLISGIIHREREYCCDDLVLAHTSEPFNYARALTTLAGLETGNGSLAVAASGQPGYLMQRIMRILELKKSTLSYGRIAAALMIVVIVTFTASQVSHSFAMIRSEVIGGPLSPGGEGVPAGTNNEEIRLVSQLRQDRLIDEAKGFIIEKRENKLFIDYKALPDPIAKKYLSPITKKELRIQVYPLQERIKRHPGSSLLQLAAPIQLSSPCVDYSTPKEDC